MSLYVAGRLDSTIIPQSSSPPPSPTSVVVVFSDVFGFASGNHRTFCDSLQTSLGPSYAVVLPDLFRGRPALRPCSCLGEFFGALCGAAAMLYRLKYQHTVENMVRGNVFGHVVPALRDLFPLARGYACVGFCYGGWVVAQSLSASHPSSSSSSSSPSVENPFHCGVGIHPSLNVESLHGRSEESLARRVLLPLLLLPAGNDSDGVKVGGACVKAMAENRDVKEEECSCLFRDMKHGWVTRGDGKKENVRREQARALKLCEEFIKSHMAADTRGDGNQI